MSLYKEIIEQQKRNKKYYKINNNPPNSGILIIIKNNNIDEIKNGNGFVHPTRKKQYTELIKNVLLKYTLHDCYIKINLSDNPVIGSFGFCRKKNDNKCFLLPNHRFTKDDIKIDHNNIEFDNFDNQKKYIHSKKKECQIHKVYTSCIPHNSKLSYFTYALNNQDICYGWAYIGGCHGKVDMSNELCEELKKKNMAGEKHVEWIEHLKYKYILYNDGNTLSDRMRLLLCSNSIIIYKSTDYEEFYTYKIKNNVNYVEYNNNSEIRVIIEKNERTKEYENIIKNNEIFVNTYLSYEEILLYTYLIIKEIC